MAISEHAQTFVGRPVVDLDSEAGQQSPKKYVHRLRLEYDSEQTMPALIADYAAQPWASSVTALVIGSWQGEDSQAGTDDIVRALVEAAPRLPALRHLFLGDIVYEENEISWINQGDLDPLLAAYPLLETLRVRGTERLTFGPVLRHAALKSLAIESGGLPAAVLAELAAADLPALEHLELWLGVSWYGGIEDVRPLGPILAGDRFPKLRYLGLRNARIADDVARAAASSPLLSRIQVLDLSMGTISDAGAEALLAAPAVRSLEKLDLSHNYLSAEMVVRLQSLGIQVVTDDRQGEDTDEDDRYNMHSE